jgi:hypothetical protein
MAGFLHRRPVSTEAPPVPGAASPVTAVPPLTAVPPEGGG